MMVKILCKCQGNCSDFSFTERSNDYFFRLMEFEDARFQKEFRMSKATFNYLNDLISPSLTKIDLVGDVIQPKKRLAIALARLVRGDYYHTIAQLYGIGEATACTICNETSKIIVDKLWSEHVSKLMPTTAEELETMQNLVSFPFAFASVDGCHIPLKCPPGGAEARKAYYNFKNFYSIILMAIVDGKGRFIWASCGQPGNCHDSTMIQSTKIWGKLYNICYLNTTEVNNVTVPALILGDGAFPFRTYLMKRYSNAVLTREQSIFNRKLSSSRIVVENAFGVLKARFRVLSKKCESLPKNLKLKTLACVVLHNILCSRGEPVEEAVDMNPPTMLANHTVGLDNDAARRVRDAIIRLVV